MTDKERILMQIVSMTAYQTTPNSLSGKYIIENDMKGSEKSQKLLIEIDNKYAWGNYWNFYGIFKLNDRFTFLVS